ncbi:DUF4062 domain-containing protein [Lentzea sp. NPDC054927]
MTTTESHVPWRRMPLFVASTFRDMDRERDLLARVVIPRVNERLRERGHGVSIYPVDLRWGVETDDRLDAETRQRVILQVCAGEVRRCRPLFLGLLGGEYGWVPPAHIGEETRVAAGVDDPGFPLSVTALEILSAVRESRDDGVAPVLLARAEAQEVPAQTRFREHLGDLPIAYEPPAFTETATAELVRLLDSVLSAPAPGDWLAEEVRAHRWAAEQEAQHFVGRQAELGRIGTFWDFMQQKYLWGKGDEANNPVHRRRVQFAPTALALVGPSGCGKSALLAMAATRMEFWDIGVKAEPVRAFVRVGATPASRNVAVCVLVLLAQLDPDAARAVAARHTPESLTLDDVLEPWLAVLRAGWRGNRPVVVVDGIDRFDGLMTESTPLAWLPIDLGDRVRLLLSAAEDSYEAEMLGLRPATEVMHVGELRLQDASALVARRIADHHKAMPAALIERLVQRSTTARWLVVASDLLTTLTAHDYVVLRNVDQREADPEAALRALLATVVEDLSPDLGDVQLEAMSRLIELVDHRLGVMLCAVGVSMAGVTEDDLRGIVGDVGLSAVSTAEMALFRDVLSAFVSVQGERWTFVHDTVEVAVDRLLAEASEAVGTDVEDRYRALLIRRLLARPVTDVSRSAELLPQLFIADELPLLVSLLTDPERSTAGSVRDFSALLLGFIRAGGADLACALITAGATDGERLTAADLLASNLPAVAERDDAARIAATCRSVIDAASPAAVDRFGRTAQDLAAVLDRITFDPFTSEGMPDPDTIWLDAVLRGGAGSLAEAPDTPEVAHDLQSQMHVLTAAVVLTEYAIFVYAGMVIPAPGDAELAASRLVRWRRTLHEAQWFDPSSARFLELQLLLTERASLLAWPEHGFTADETDFAQVRAFLDRARGNPGVVAMFGTAARLRALGCVEGMSDDLASPLVQDTLTCLDEAIWEMDVQRFLTPDAFLVELRMIQCRLAHMSMLASFGQLGSACATGLPALTTQHAVEVIGWPDFVERAAQWCIWWTEVLGNDDPRPVVERFAFEIDQRPWTLDAEDTQLCEELTLGTAARAAKRFGHFDLAERMVERTSERVGAGLVAEPEDGPFAGVVLEVVEEMEVQIEAASREDLDEEDEEEVLKTTTAVRRLRDLTERLLR